MDHHHHHHSHGHHTFDHHHHHHTHNHHHTHDHHKHHDQDDDDDHHHHHHHKHHHQEQDVLSLVTPALMLYQSQKGSQLEKQSGPQSQTSKSSVLPLPPPSLITEPERRVPPLPPRAVDARDFKERAFTVGIGGPEGTGKKALMLALCRSLRDKYSLGAVLSKENDTDFWSGNMTSLFKSSTFTRWMLKILSCFTLDMDNMISDREFLVKHGALPEERIRAVETGGCPQIAIRKELSKLYKVDILVCESGGDTLAANFSREGTDFMIYMIDVSGCDKIPTKVCPGINQADLLVINNTDLAKAVGADLDVKKRDAFRMRNGRPFVFSQMKHGVGVQKIVNHILQAWEAATGMKRR